MVYSSPLNFKNMKSRILTLITLIGFLSSCHRWTVDPSPGDSAYDNFDNMWRTINERYSFFDYKDIDWNAIRSQYESRISSNMSNEELAFVLGDMLAELRDGHVNLYSPYNNHRNWSWFENFPANFDPVIAERNYWGSDYRIGTGSLRHNFLQDSLTDIGYIYVPSFGVVFNEEELDHIIRRYKDTRGLILDLRDNGGGIVFTASDLAGRFTNSTIKPLIERWKNGPEKNSFSESTTLEVEPSGNAKYLNKPVILLTNRSCYSACNRFTAIMRAIPNVMVIGDRTGGGGGYPSDFELPNGWGYRFSTTDSYMPEGNLPNGYPVGSDPDYGQFDEIVSGLGFNVELGIPPDIVVEQTDTDKGAGIDPLIERAVQEIRN